MEESVRELDNLLKADGGIEVSYLKLTRYAKYRLTSALILNPQNKALGELEPTDLVHHAFGRLIEEGAGNKRPYYGLRNFVDNRIRTLSKSPKTNAVVPVGGDDAEWSEFWEAAFDPVNETPADAAEKSDSVSQTKRLVFRLRDFFQQDNDVIELVTAWDCNYTTRKEIIANSALGGPAYDRAYKRLRRQATKLQREASNE